MNKKNVLVMVLAMLLVCVISVGGTLAWIADETEEVVNTFTVGDIKITLDEADLKPYDSATNYYEADRTVDRVKANSYKIRPGVKMDKDPQVHVLPDSEAAYIRMFVEITDIAAVQGVFGAGFLPETLVEGWNPAIWVSTKTVDTTTKTGSAIYEFRYHEVVDTVDAGVRDLEPLFTQIKIPTNLDGDDIKDLDSVQVIVTAQAIQADGFTSADAAWAEWGK